MSTGSYNVTLDTYNRSLKDWAGGNGRDQDNAYGCTWTRITGSKAQLWSRYPYGYYVYQMDQYIYPPNNLVLPSFTNEELSAYVKLADAIRGHSFDSSVALGELPQTTAMIKSNALKVFTAYRHLKNGKWEDCLRALGMFGKSKGPRSLSTNDLAGFWLELQYGWKPLLADIDEACKAIDSARAKVGMVFRSRQTTKTQVSGNARGDPAYRTCTVGLKCTLHEDPSTMAHYGGQNPLTMVWELLPWSFVLDWFIPVGNYLEASSFFSGFKKTILVSRFRSHEFKAKYGTSPSPPYDEYRGGGYSVFIMSFQRSFADSAIPLPSFKSMEKALSLGHLKNAGALIAQQVRISR